MRNSALGPKLILSRAQVDDMDEDVPEEPDDFETIIIQKKKIKYKQRRDDRFDAKGRRIAKGTGYTINFDSFITVCVFDPEEEVVQIKNTLSQCSQGIEITRQNQKQQLKHKEEHDMNEIILLSILKKGKSK